MTRPVGRPATGETPGRHIRLSDELWAEVGEVAQDEGRDKTAVVRDALARYIARHKRRREGAAT